MKREPGGGDRKKEGCQLYTGSLDTRSSGATSSQPSSLTDEVAVGVDFFDSISTDRLVGSHVGSCSGSQFDSDILKKRADDFLFTGGARHFRHAPQLSILGNRRDRAVICPKITTSRGRETVDTSPLPSARMAVPFGLEYRGWQGADKHT